MARALPAEVRPRRKYDTWTLGELPRLLLRELLTRGVTVGLLGQSLCVAPSGPRNIGYEQRKHRKHLGEGFSRLQASRRSLVDEDEQSWTTFERLYVFVGVMLVSVLGLWTCKASKDYRDARAAAPLDAQMAAPSVVREVPLKRAKPGRESLPLP